MKTLILMILAAGVFYSLQRRKLTQLEAQLQQVVRHIPAQSPVSESKERSVFRPLGEVDSTRVSNLLDLYLELALASRGGKEVDDHEVNRCQLKLAELLERMSADEILAIIPPDSDLSTGNPPGPDAMRFAVIMLLLKSVNPEAGLAVVRTLGGVPNRDEAISDQFNAWVKLDPEFALRWYDKEITQGASDLKTFEIRRSLVTARAVVDPAAAIDQMVKGIEGDDFEDQGRGLWGSMTEAFYELEDFQNFFSELHQATDKLPNSEALAEVRAEFMVQLTRELIQQRYDDAVSFMAIHFNEQDTELFAERISTKSLPERGKWATWLSERSNLAHFKSFFGGWTATEYISAGEWLSDFPASGTKNKAVITYAFQVATIDKNAAKEWAETLPESKEKERLFHQIEQRGK